jgi:hypothetical protein
VGWEPKGTATLLLFQLLLVRPLRLRLLLFINAAAPTPTATLLLFYNSTFRLVKFVTTTLGVPIKKQSTPLRTRDTAT